jgi:hypothetical protein
MIPWMDLMAVQFTIIDILRALAYLLRLTGLV